MVDMHFLLLLFFMPVSIILAKFKNNFDQIYKKIKILFCIVVVVFLTRNYIRINEEYNKYNYNPLKNLFIKLMKDILELKKNFLNLLITLKNVKNH